MKLLKQNLFLFLGAVFLYACTSSTDEPTSLPVVTTGSYSSLTPTTVVLAGNVSSEGGGTVTKGICWSVNENPTINDSQTDGGTGTGAYTCTLTGLSASTTYYARAFATNSIGTSYGSQVTFTTSDPSAPVVSTTALSSISATGAVCGGEITSDGGATVTAKGVCWSASTGPTVALTTKTTDGTGTGTFTSTISGLTLGTTYYVRAYATNSLGTSYGSELTFTTTSSSSGVLSAIVSTSTYNGPYAPKHVFAAWITNSSGTFIKSLMVYAAARKSDLTYWKASSSGNTTDATTGATLSSHSSHTLNWNGTNTSGAVVDDGDYKLNVEFTESNGTGKYTTFTFKKGSSTASLTSSTANNISLSSLSWVPN